MPANIIIGNINPPVVPNTETAPRIWTKSEYRDGTRPVLLPPVVPPVEGNGPFDLTDTRYDDFRSDFLAIDSNTPAAIIDMDDVYAEGQAYRDSFLSSGTDHGFKVEKFPPPNGSPSNNGTMTLGWEENDDGRYVVTWEAETNDPGYDSEAGDTWDGMRMWIGTANLNNFITNVFSGADDIPLNRLCIEIEFPDDSMTWASQDTVTTAVAGDQSLGQCANPGSAGEFATMYFETGTYTATRRDAEGTTQSAENGGTFQSGDSHFYHKFTRYGAHPLDKFYMVDSKTAVFCIGPIPDGCRSGMRPSYVCNPLQTVVGETASVTDAFAYHSYLSRFYFDLWNIANVKYPFKIKIKRIWMQYEPDDIMILSDNNGLRDMKLTLNSTAVNYTATLKNKATVNRTYRISLAAGGGLPFTGDSSLWKAYIDTDEVGEVNGNSVQLVSGQTIELTAETDYPLLFVHTPDFTSSYQTGQVTNYSREKAVASFALVETTRMRSASYAVISWEAADQNEVDTQASILPNLQYPDDGLGSPGVYSTRSEYNQDREDTGWFIRDWPDYVEFTA